MALQGNQKLKVSMTAHCKQQQYSSSVVYGLVSQHAFYAMIPVLIPQRTGMTRSPADVAGWIQKMVLRRRSDAREGHSCRVLACDVLCPCHSHSGKGKFWCVSVKKHDKVSVRCIVQYLQIQSTLSAQGKGATPRDG